MSFQGIFISILIMFVMFFTFLRLFLGGIKLYQLNNSAYKKRKKGETFKEWLLYSRYKEEIPTVLRAFYFLVLLIHTAALISCCIFAYIINVPIEIGRMILGGIIAFDFIWLLVIALLFWSPRPGFAYERWITKKRGQKRK